MPTKVSGNIDPSDLSALRRELRRIADLLNGQPKYVPTSVQTDDYTAKVGELVLVDPSLGTITVTLETAAGSRGQSVVVKNSSSSTNVITIDPNGSETIDGSSTDTIGAPYASRTYVSDGDNWVIV